MNTFLNLNTLVRSSKRNRLFIVARLSYAVIGKGRLRLPVCIESSRVTGPGNNSVRQVAACVVIFSIVLVASASDEVAIHPPDRIFQPDDVRQALGRIRQKQKLADVIKRVTTEPDKLNGLAELARQIGNQMAPRPDSQKSEAADSPLRQFAERLAKDPGFRETAVRLANSPQFRESAESLLKDPAVRALAERFARDVGLSGSKLAQTDPPGRSPHDSVAGGRDAKSAAPGRSRKDAGTPHSGRSDWPFDLQKMAGESKWPRPVGESFLESARRMGDANPLLDRSPALSRFVRRLEDNRLATDAPPAGIADWIATLPQAPLVPQSTERTPAARIPSSGNATNMRRLINRFESRLRKRLPATSAPTLSPPRISLPKMSPPSLSFRPQLMPGTLQLGAPDLGSMVRAAAIAIALVGVAVMLFWSSRAQLRRAIVVRACRLRLQDASMTVRERIKGLFESLAITLLGESARPNHHHCIAGRLARKMPAARDSALALADLYERARYTPLDESLSTEELTLASQHSQRVTRIWTSIAGSLWQSHAASRADD